MIVLAIVAAVYLLIGIAFTYSVRRMIGMKLIVSLFIWPIVILFWPIALFLFMMGNM